MVFILKHVKEPAQFTEYKKAYAQVGLTLIEYIQQIPFDFKIEHIGSTAIPGCGGKGIIDLMMACHPDDFIAIRTAIDQLGFQKQSAKEPFPESRPMRVGRIYWQNQDYSIHLHLVTNKDEFNRHLAFRDKLRKNHDLVQEYEAVKKGILQVGITDSENYCSRKSSWIENLTY